MRTIGLLMVADETDILERTLDHNAALVDSFYVLDGSDNPDESRAICAAHPHCHGYTTDTDIPWPGPPRDGWRQHLLRQAYADHGRDNWFLLLHGDELWTFDPADLTDRFDADGFGFRLPFYFPRAGELWQDDVHPLDQLRWRLGPGWPEIRMFKGGANVAYHPDQHFSVQPAGLQSVLAVDAEILHYPYRAPDVQRARAARHKHTGFDPDNYQHILDRDAVYWDDAMIKRYRRTPEFADLHVDAAGVR